MAGAGYKLFNTGDVLTAAQVNTYLQEQTVMVFASSTARTTALSSVLAEGMMSYLQDTNAVEVYNGSAWVSVGSTGDITGVTAGTGLSGGGTSGDVTLSLSTPVSATNGGTAQTTYATGDLLYASASNTLSKRSIGSTGDVLTVSGGVPTWTAPTASASGLTFIKKQTVGTSVTSVEVTGAFSATYDNYLITFTGGSSSSDGADINIKFGAATSGYKYAGTYMLYTSATLNSYATDSAGSITVGGMSSNGASSFIYVMSPYLSARTGVIGHTTSLHSSEYWQDYKGVLDNTTSYTSFIIASANSFTGGEIRVYGYQNS